MANVLSSQQRWVNQDWSERHWHHDVAKILVAALVIAAVLFLTPRAAAFEIQDSGISVAQQELQLS